MVIEGLPSRIQILICRLAQVSFELPHQRWHNPATLLPILGEVKSKMFLRSIARKSLLVVVMLLLSTAAMAQGAPASKAEDVSLPRIVKQTQLVYVPVVVEDKHGKTLGGLTRDSFVVQQDGKEQNIAIFEEVKTARDFSQRAPAIAPGMVENFALNDTQARKTVIIILDTLNSQILDLNRAKKSLVHFIQKSLSPDQPVALMVLNSNGLHQIHSITADPAILLDSVKRVEAHYNRGSKDPDPLGISSRAQTTDAVRYDPSSSLSRDPQAEAQAMANYLDQVESHYFQREAALTTLKSLEQLAGSFAGIPGRKSVIWATSGFPINIQDPHSFGGVDTDLYTSYERAWERLNDANLAIYPIDISGLQVRSVPSVDRRPDPRNGGFRPVATYNLQQEQQMSLLSFAAATGGKAFLNSNDIEGSFAKAAQEANAYYLIGYYLHEGDDHPGWHKLKVHVKGSHGDIRARDGFLVGSGKVTEKDRLKELTVALSAPADYTGIHFGIRLPSDPKPTTTSAQSGERRNKTVHVSFAPGALNVDMDKSNLVSADFAMIALLNDRTVGQTLRSVHLNLKPQDLQMVAKKGLGFEDTISVPPGEYELRVAVRDLTNGKIGTLRTHLVVP